MLPSCIERGVTIIRNILINDRLMNFQEYVARFGNYTRAQLDYNVLRNAIMKLPLQGPFPEETDNKYYFKGIEIGSIGRKKIYEELQDADQPYINGRWFRKYQVDLSEGYWNLAVDCTSETRLRVLQWKVLHNIYPTNILLKKMGITDTDLCSTCKEMDYTEHFFFRCSQVQPLWQEIENRLAAYLGFRIHISEQVVMIGILNDNRVSKSDLKVINHAILIGKMSISIFRYGKMKNLMIIFEQAATYRKLAC